MHHFNLAQNVLLRPAQATQEPVPVEGSAADAEGANFVQPDCAKPPTLLGNLHKAMGLADVVREGMLQDPHRSSHIAGSRRAHLVAHLDGRVDAANLHCRAGVTALNL